MCSVRYLRLSSGLVLAYISVVTTEKCPRKMELSDFLGHRSVSTTEIYAAVSLKMKWELLEAVATAPKTRDYPDWSEDKDLMSWLKSLC